MDDVRHMTLPGKILAQSDICHAAYALYLAGEHEADPDKKAALKRVEDALNDITNWTGVEAVASDAIVLSDE